MDGSGEEKRKRQLLLVAAVGVSIVVIAIIASFLPVGASFSGEGSYNCGTPFRRWRSPAALRREWRKDTAKIEKAYPAAKVSAKTPLVVCPSRVRTRYAIVAAVGGFASLLVVTALGIYWYQFGFIRDPHV